MSWCDRLDVEAEVGDIFQTDADGLVCTVTVNLGPYGAISRHLFARGGAALADDLEALRSTLPGNRLQLGQATSLPIRAEHTLDVRGWLILAGLWAHESAYTPELLYGVYIASLRQAFERHLVSLAMPIFTGGGADLTFDAILRVLRDLDGLRTSDGFTVERLRFVSRKERDVEALAQALRQGLAGL